jgi:hypothetical protein
LAKVVMRPNWPADMMPRSSSPTISDPFQKLIAQCCLNEAIMQRMPLWVNAGTDHFISSFASGTAACTTSRMCARIGRANSGLFAM